jgi:hypothetical protein
MELGAGRDHLVFELEFSFSAGRLRIGNGVFEVWQSDESPYAEGFRSLKCVQSYFPGKTNFFAGMLADAVDCVRDRQRVPVSQAEDALAVIEYISALEAAYVVEKVRRYDVQGKNILNVREKYYPADVSFVHALLGYDMRRLPGMLETLVYHELRRRGYEVFTGQLGEREIDFVAVKGAEKQYIQTTYLINNDESVIQREFVNMLAIPDQHPKLVLSLDEHWTGNVEGVRHQYLGDWLKTQGAV